MKVVIVYDDAAAGTRAIRELGRQKAAHPAVNFCPTPWSFDYLAEIPFRQRALHELDSADLLVISISHLEETPAAIIHWLRTCLHRPRVQSIPVLALFDDDFAWTLMLEGHLAAADAPAIMPITAASGRKQAPFPFSRLSPQSLRACA
jgi:hypothetical protein